MGISDDFASADAQCCFSDPLYIFKVTTLSVVGELTVLSNTTTWVFSAAHHLLSW